MKKLIVLRELTIVFAIYFILYGILLFEVPTEVYETKQAGISVKDSMSWGEWYVFRNDTEKEKIVNFFHLPLIGKKESVSPFDGVIAPHKVVCVSVPKGYVDLIDICELDSRRGSFSSVACISASRLRSGFKE